MANFDGLENYFGIGSLNTGMVDDATYTGKLTGVQESLNYRRFHWSVQTRLYEKFVDLNDARDTTSDLINLPGVKDGVRPFQDDWFSIYPYRRRARRLYPDEILNNQPENV